LFSEKTIFFAPLDWGLGHATRSVPLIRELQSNNSIILGVTPLTKPIFDEEFPRLKQVEVPSYKIEYSAYFPLWLKLAMDSGKIKKIISNEHQLLDELISKYKIDVVISDNRFGMHAERIKTVFMTHQLFLKAPVLASLASGINKNYIRKFSEVWVPDYEDETESLSGELSHGKQYRGNVKYIGPQSRLADVSVNAQENKYDILVLLSGPEPQRSILEEIAVKKFSGRKNIALVRGNRGQEPESRRQSVEGINIFDLPAKEKLKELILSSRKIICRSGYSTLMDLHLLGKKDLLLIPTPGQSEQEYLAEYWNKKFGIQFCQQKYLPQFLI
jgi:predicted glycosyltransferase